MRGLHRGGLAAAGTVLMLCLPAAASGTEGTGTADTTAVHAVSRLHAVSPPPRLAHAAVRWSRQPRLFATRRSLTGPTVVGLDAGVDARALAADPRVRYAAAPQRLTLQHDRNDPLTTTVDPHTKLPYEWAFEHLGVDRALNLTKGDPSIVVGVVDSGYGAGVRDLTGKIASAWYFSSEASDAFDTEGHGTFVSSIIGAGNDDGYGLAGFCGACRLDVFKNVGLYDYQVAAAVKQLVDDHVRIINLSLGSNLYDYVLADAVDYAVAAGVLVVASSGNDGGPVIYPAALLQPANGGPSLGLAVGASTVRDRKASFSNSGANLSLVAPGSFDDTCARGVWAALPTPASEFDDGSACATVFHASSSGQRYAYANGTSFSAPEVAGVAALVWAARPDLTAPQVAQIIEQSATRPAQLWTSDLGWGVLNAAKALELATGLSSADTLTVTSVGAVAPAHAGRRFSVAATATWQDGAAVRLGTMRCSASLGGRFLTSAAFRFTGGKAVCAFQVPKRAAGRTILVRVGITDDERNAGTASRSFAVHR